MPQTFTRENQRRSLLADGLRRVLANKRYILWFWLLNLVLATAGTSAFRESSHAILDHRLYSEGLTQGFRLAVFFDLLARPEFGSTATIVSPAVWLVCAFFLATALFLPGVFAGYSSTYRLPREDFFRACGRNLWRFIRLMIVAGIIMSIVAGLVFAANGAIAKKAGESTNERLPFTLQMIGLLIIFLIMTSLRIWFDLAEADVVLNDQRAVRKSIRSGFRQAFSSMARLLTSYVVAAIIAAVILVLGIWCWNRFIPSTSVTRAFVLSQLIMFSLLIPRFWQRGMAVSYWQEKMLMPLVEVHPVEPTVIPVAATPDPTPVPPPAIAEPPTTPDTT
jgi:hypothetical protein